MLGPYQYFAGDTMSAEAHRIANTIVSMRDNLAGTATFLMVLNSPAYTSILESFGIDAGSAVKFGRMDGTSHPPLDVQASVARIRGNPQYNLDYIGVFLMATVSLVADGLSRNSYFTKSPELEFLRHIRNAIAHGNCFFLKPGEPRRPAHFKNFTISPALQGTEVFWKFMKPGDMLDLLETVEAQLRALA